MIILIYVHTKKIHLHERISRTFSLSLSLYMPSTNHWHNFNCTFRFAIALTFHAEALSLPSAHLSFLLFPRRFNHRNQITQLFILRLLLRVLLFVTRSFPARNVVLEVETFVQPSYPSCELLARVEISFSFSQGEPLRLPRELKISRRRLSPLSLEKRKEREKIIAHSPACARAFYAVSLFLPAPGEMVMFGWCYRAGGLTVVTVDSQLVHGRNSADRFDGGS